MIAAYIDASVLIRIVLREPNPLQEWDELELGVSSHLLRVECHRTMHRLWLHNQLDDAEYEAKRMKIETMLGYLELVAVDEHVLAQATEAVPVAITSLDALHLVSAMQYRSAQPSDERPLIFATHDVALAHAARAMHFDVIGVTL